LGTGWVLPGGNGALPAYWAESSRARWRVSVERSPAAPGESVDTLSPAAPPALRAPSPWDGEEKALSPGTSLIWADRAEARILADLTDSSLHLPLDLSGQLSAAIGVEAGFGQLLERDAGDPLGVHGQQLPARQAQRQLDDLATDPDVALQHLRRQVA